MIRGENADSDEEFVKNLAASSGDKVYSKRIDCNNYAKIKKIGIEEAGREIRYDFFNEVFSLENCTKVATAHNLDDNVETFLFRLMRGSSINGLGGIPIIREKFIRPILFFEKKDILLYLYEKKIDFVHDSTNDESLYTRNKIRLELIPYIEKEFNSKFKEKINNLILEIEKINSETNIELSEFLVNDMIEIEKIRNLKEFMIKNILNSYLKYKGAESNREIIDKLYEIIMKDGNFSYDIGKKLQFNKKYGKISIFEKEEITKSEYQHKINDLDNYVILKTNYNIEIFPNVIAKTSAGNTFYLANRYIQKEDFFIRNRRAGDFIYLDGMSGAKKIKKLFIDLKIDSNIRNNIPMITIGNEVLFIPQVKVSKNFKALQGEESMKIIFKEAYFGR